MNGTKIVRVLAPNPSPMTLEGTNSYLVVGRGDAIAIDPGPPDATHVQRIVAMAKEHGAEIGAIAVTHGHPDHAPGAALLHASTGAPVYGHRDAAFPVDAHVGDGDAIRIAGASLAVIDAPGHARDHLVFWEETQGALFTGDVVIGRGTIVIAPPNGDMRAYQATLARLRKEFAAARTIFGGHGDAVADPSAKLDEYIAHRERRERELLDALAPGDRTVPELVATIYRDVAAMLWPAAARQIVAYLIALEREGRVRSRSLDRPPTASERALLNPDLSTMVDAQSAAVARAELGFDRNITEIEAYRLAG